MILLQLSDLFSFILFHFFLVLVCFSSFLLVYLVISFSFRFCWAGQHHGQSLPWALWLQLSYMLVDVWWSPPTSRGRWSQQGWCYCIWSLPHVAVEATACVRLLQLIRVQTTQLFTLFLRLDFLLFLVLLISPHIWNLYRLSLYLRLTLCNSIEVDMLCVEKFPVLTKIFPHNYYQSQYSC